MARQRLGPISKQIEEAFPFLVNLSKVLPNGETFLPGSSSLSSVLKSTGADTTTALFGVPVPTVIVDAARVGGDLPVHGTGVIGRHIISLDAVTDAGTKFEAEVDVDVVEYREAIHFVDKVLAEVFAVGVDFDIEFDPGETISSGSTKSVLKSETTVTIARSGATATVTHTSHGLTTGDEVSIVGANQNEYNGVHTITVATASTYTYTVAGTPDTPATGTITSRLITTADLINGSAQVNGTAVSANLKAGAPAQVARHFVQVTAITSLSRRFSDQIEVVVES